MRDSLRQGEKYIPGSGVWYEDGERTATERLADQGPSVFDQFAKREAKRFIESLSSSLSERQQAVLIMRHWDDETFEGIAKRLSITRKSAYYLHARALVALGKAFSAMKIYHVRDLI